jgi:hypothetical protein
MDILAKARELEARLARTVDRARGPRDARPVVEHASRSRSRTPSSSGGARGAAGGARDATCSRSTGSRCWWWRREAGARAFEATFAVEPTLAQRIHTRLETAGCAPAGLGSRVDYVDAAGEGWTAPDVHVDFDRVDEPLPEPPAASRWASRRRARACRRAAARGGDRDRGGAAEQPLYSFQFARIDLGRCTHVRDRRNQLVRTNHVAFADTDDAAQPTVSRRHAHLEYSASGARLSRVRRRERAGHGRVARRPHDRRCTPGARGVRLQPGDEILLGNARLRVKMANRS